MKARQFLVALPELLGYTNSAALEENVYMALYYALSGDGAYLDELFEVDVEDHLEDYAWDPKNLPTTPFYENVRVTGDYLHPPDMACGRLLDDGEWIYRCDECGYDDTCVMCSRCFNRADHTDHNVRAYMSSSDGGTCDCGDDTAFVNKLNCLCQVRSTATPALEERHKAIIHDVVKLVLDFILDVTNFSVATLPLIHSNINTGELTSESLSNAGSLPLAKYGEDRNSDLWYLLLWNDENHDYPEAEAGIRAATGLDELKAAELAYEINAVGRAVLKESLSYKSLLKSQKAAQTDGLVATICTARDFMREEIVHLMLCWLKDASCFEGSMAVRNEVKRCLAELLLEPGYLFQNHVPVELLSASDLRKACFENGLLYEGKLLNLATVKPRLHVTGPISITDSLSLMVELDKNFELANSRLQLLLAFEVRFKSASRKVLSKFLPSVLISSLEIKARFCNQYVDAFPTLMSIFAFSDREEELASVVNISVQLFTCPRTNQLVIESGKFGNLLAPSTLLMESHASKLNEDGILNTVDLVVDIKTKREKSSIQKTVITYMDVIGKILANNDCTDLLGMVLLNNNIYNMLFFLRCFQGLLPLTRKYGDHVERESLLDFVTFLQKGIPVLEIVKHCVSTTKPINPQALGTAIKIVCVFLNSRGKNGRSSVVTKDPVSLLNPVNSLLALLLQKAGDITGPIEEIFSEQSILGISEYSLISIVLTSQIKVGLWIRNGFAVSRQGSYYSEAKISQVSYFGDFYLNQVAMLVEDPTKVLAQFVRVWQLTPWTENKYDYTKRDVYESSSWKPANADEENIAAYDNKWGVMCEQFILFLYNLLTDRLLFNDSESSALFRAKVKKVISQVLCQGPKSYSELRKEVPSSFFNDKNFDEILRENADFQAPSGFTDSGIYRLKDEVYGELDPFSTLDSGVSQNVYEALCAHNKQTKKSMTIEPKFIMSEFPSINQKLGQFTRTAAFIEMIKNLLEVSLSCKNEEFLPHLLQLTHAALKDAEYVLGNDYLDDTFRTTSILGALLKTFESGMTSNITEKARHVLKLILSKDETLLDAMTAEFGTERLNAFETRLPAQEPKKPNAAAGRNAKIMKKFEAQRKRFLKSQGDEDMSMDNSESENNYTKNNVERCVACGELQDFEKPFGIPLATMDSSIFENLPRGLVKEGLADWSHVEPLPEGKVYSRAFPIEDKVTNLVGTTCGHGIHVDCTQHPGFDGLMKCPLCHSVHEDIIPIYAPEHDGPFLQDHVIWGGASSLGSKRSFSRFRDLMSMTIKSDYYDAHSKYPRHDTRLHPFFNSVGGVSDEQSPEEINCTVNQICFLIADTIRATEISLRSDGRESLRNFILQSPAKLKMQVRGMIQGFSIFCDEFSNVLSKSAFTHPYGGSQIDFDSVFKETVFSFLQTDNSLVGAFRFGYAKLIALTLNGLTQDYVDELTSYECDFHLVDSKARIFRKFCKDLFDVDLKKGMEHTVFFALERFLLPYLRCCALLMDIALSTKVSGDNEFTSDKRFESFAFQVDEQEYEYSSDALCDMCELPRLHDLMALYCGGAGLNERDDTAKKEMWFEIQVLEKFAQNISTLDSSVKKLEYPNVSRLVQLPDSYNAVVTDSELKELHEGICLVCGEYIHQNQEKLHFRKSPECTSPSLIFCPDNRIVVTITIGHAMTRTATIPGPYMTEHGEVATQKRQGKAKLNHRRYAQLNKMYLNQDLFGYVTRSSFGTSPGGLNANQFALPPALEAGALRRRIIETIEFDGADEFEGGVESDSDSDAWFV